MDPVGPETGYDLPQQRADIVTVSHDDPGHAALDRVQPGYRAITGPGEYEISEVFIQGVQTYPKRTDDQPSPIHTLYRVEIDDLVICHLGALDQMLTEEQTAALSAVDVLLVPIGGGAVLDAARAAEVIALLEPSIVIPMLYRTEQGDHDLEPLDRFLKVMGGTDVEPRDRITIRKADLSGGEQTDVKVLQP